MRREGMAFAHYAPAVAPALSHCTLVEGVSLQAPQALRALVERQGLTGCATSYLLDQDEYQLLLVEAPEVPEAELAEALKWRIKDLIAHDIAEVVFDYLFLPEDAYRARRMLYVAVMHREVAERIEAFVTAAGLALDTLDIPELALLNVAALLPAESTGTALLGLQPGRSHINLLADGALYLTRPMETPGAVLAPNVEEIESRAGGIVLDIQRSLDYYESQIGKPPCLKLLVCPLQPGETPLLSQLRYNLPVELAQLDLGELLTSADPLTPALQGQCLLAIAAALRTKTDAGHSINLYVRQEPVRVPFSGVACGAIVLVTALAMAAAYGVTARNLAESRGELAGLKEEKAALQAEIDQLEQARRQLVPSPALKGRIGSLEQELDAKQTYLTLLDSLQPEQRTAFSTLLRGLAEQDLPGLWLTRIQAGEGGRRFALEGGVLQAALVTQYLERLGDEPGYRQARFDDFSLSEGEPGLRFALQARLVPGVVDEVSARTPREDAAGGVQ